ncbi:MAG TPA: PIN domain-containing protein [Bacteroidia bacterium]|nr:PIN domain-containing protein [Bacteroidia bacterium]
MRRSNYRAVLDACVLANHGVCDLLLRLAERPRLYTPVWSPDILEETVRTQITKLKWPPELADHWRSEVMRYFPESLVDDASCLEPVLTNDVKDRHVLAAAIRAGALTIVTFNLCDFSSPSLEPWSIRAVHPADYLITLHTIAPDVVVAKLMEMVRDRQTKDPGLTPQVYLSKLARSVPAFAAHLADSLGW